jgi:hypothetical protein
VPALARRIAPESIVLFKQTIIINNLTPNKMKRVKTSLSVLTVLLAISICLFAGCNKDGTGGKYFLTAKVNGVEWTSASEQYAAGYQSVNNFLYISGATSDENEILSISFFNFPGTTGTYSIGTGDYEFMCFYTVGSTSYYVFNDEAGAVGTLKITTFDSKTVKGTFSFSAVTPGGTATIEITEGKFSLPLIPM